MSASKIKRHRMIYDLLRSHSGMSVSQVRSELAERGCRVDRRTVDRDIRIDMAEDGRYGIVAHEDTHPEMFSIMPGHSPKIEFLFSDENIQVLGLALKSLRKTTSNEFVDRIDELETAIREKLNAGLNKVLLASHHHAEIQYPTGGKSKKGARPDVDVVLKALREGRMISCRYASLTSPSKSADIRRYEPLSFEVFDGRFYLIVRDTEDPRNKYKRLKLSRMSEAKILPERVTVTKADVKDFKAFHNNFGAFGGPNAEMIEVVLRGDDTLGEFFDDREFAPEQKVEKKGDGDWEIKIKIADSWPFARLLAGFGGNIHAIEPAALRNRVKGLWELGLRQVG